MSGRLALRLGTVVGTEPLEVEVAGERRRAWADESLVGEAQEGDRVVVNVAALDLDLGSGGFDVVHANLTRGLDGGAGGGAHVMKLNYTSLQHAVEPVERRHERVGARPAMPVVVLPLHGHLAPVAWAAAQAAPAARLGYVQSGGGALPGSLSRDVRMLRGSGLLADHVTAAPAYGGEREALSVLGALDAAAELDWDAALVGPGPGIIGSDSAYGHGGMAALDNAHAALALGLPALISPRLSSGDPRDRHRGVSHHTRTVLDLLLAPAEVAVPAGEPEIGAELAGDRHRALAAQADLDGYERSGLPSTTMGRGLREDPLFFAAPLAAGGLLGERLSAPPAASA